MPIDSSTYVEGLEQINGTRQVTETHVDHLGIRHIYTWFRQQSDDVQAVVTGRVARLLEQLKDAEINKNVALVMFDGSLAQYTLDYSVANDNFAALREAYKTATRVEAIMIGDFLSSLSDATLRNQFSMTQQQVTNLRTNKLTPAANAAATIRATTGA